MNSLERLKLAAASEEFSDREIEQIFLNISVNNKEELDEIVNLLAQYRPEVAQSILKRFLSNLS